MTSNISTSSIIHPKTLKETEINITQMRSLKEAIKDAFYREEETYSSLSQEVANALRGSTLKTYLLRIIEAKINILSLKVPGMRRTTKYLIAAREKEIKHEEGVLENLNLSRPRKLKEDALSALEKISQSVLSEITKVIYQTIDPLHRRYLIALRINIKKVSKELKEQINQTNQRSELIDILRGHTISCGGIIQYDKINQEGYDETTLKCLD